MNRFAVLSACACAAALWGAAVLTAAQTPGATQEKFPEAPLALSRPAVPAVTWTRWSAPVDRIVAADLRSRRIAEPAVVNDTVFARRVYLDVWGLLPTPAQLHAFTTDTTPGKRARLVHTLLADTDQYAEHWISFWNDLLRNEDGVSYFSETAGRKSITEWLLPSLKSNLPYDQFVTKLLNPVLPADPAGFVIGVNWRGETTPAVTPWMQAAQNTAQVFLGLNLKCNACHDSFISKWKLKDAYALAAYFSTEPQLQLFRCEAAQNRFTGPGFLFPEIAHVPASNALADRRAAAAASFTDPRNGRFPRTLVNRVWQRLLGHGLVPNADEMDGTPWNAALLDLLASDFADHRYDVKYVIETILTSRAYQMPSVARTNEATEKDYAFAGPEVRRLTAEQFADAIGAITGEWSLYGIGRTAPGGLYGRDWRGPSSGLTRALGRPVRDQVTSTRATQASTLQALELVNGDLLTRWLMRGAQRMLGVLPPEPVSLLQRSFSGRSAAPAALQVDVTGAKTLWLVVEENGSNVKPDELQPAWAQAVFEGATGPTALSALTPRDLGGLRPGTGPIGFGAPDANGVRVRNPSVLVYDIGGKGFTSFRALVGIENAKEEIGSTLNPQIRFYVFDREPNMTNLNPPSAGATLPPPAPAVRTVTQAIDRVFWSALGRAPLAAERRAAEQVLQDPAGGTRPSPQGLADLLWALAMKPEFQFIY